jgi:uncharacterized protein
LEPASQTKQRLITTLLAAFLFALFAGTGQGQTSVSPIPLPQPFTPIVDNANVINPDTKARLETIYQNLKERAQIEFAVVTVPTTGDLDIFDYSLAVARGWGIGSKAGERNGLLLLVAVNDRKYFTQVSRHLEGDLPDGLVGQIQRERLVPQFRKGNYSQGIYETIQAYLATLATKRGFSVEGIDLSYARKLTVEEPRSRPNISLGTCCTVLIIIAVIILVLSSSRGKGGGCLQALLLGSLLSNIGRSSGSGWSGGGFGGGGGGFGGGGFGGGFGGGGDFGGGGSGGSW